MKYIQLTLPILSSWKGSAEVQLAGHLHKYTWNHCHHHCHIFSLKDDEYELNPNQVGSSPLPGSMARNREFMSTSQCRLSITANPPSSSSPLPFALGWSCILVLYISNHWIGTVRTSTVTGHFHFSSSKSIIMMIFVNSASWTLLTISTYSTSWSTSRASPLLLIASDQNCVGIQSTCQTHFRPVW